MRILYVSHTYVTAENQKKIRAIAALPDVELSLVVPHIWREPVLKEIKAHVPADVPFRARSIRAVWPGVEQYYWYLSTDLSMRHFKPDVLCVEQGAGALAYTQSLIYRNLYASRAKAVFFT